MIALSNGNARLLKSEEGVNKYKTWCKEAKTDREAYTIIVEHSVWPD